MKTQKLILAISLCLLPYTANADLDLTNSTNQYATSYLDELGFCSGNLGGILPPGMGITIDTLRIYYLCKMQVPCNATFIISSNKEDAKNCKGTKVATARIDDLETDIVSELTVLDSQYKITGQGTNTLKITK